MAEGGSAGRDLKYSMQISWPFLPGGPIARGKRTDEDIIDSGGSCGFRY